MNQRMNEKDLTDLQLAEQIAVHQELMDKHSLEINKLAQSLNALKQELSVRLEKNKTAAVEPTAEEAPKPENVSAPV